MDELYKIRAFMDVVENGSFSAAARQHDVSVSSIARRIAALEDELGVRLVNRNTRQVSITDTGTHFYRRVREAVRELESAKVEASSYQESVKGVLRVSIRISVGALILPELERFLDRYPGLKIDVSLTDERVDLLQNNIDVAVWVGRLADSELVAKRLSPGRRILCGSPDYIARYGAPQHPTDLTQHKCLAFKSKDYDGIWRFIKEGENWEIPAEGPFYSSSGLALSSAALSGMGLVVLQHYMVEKELKAGRLMPLLMDYDVILTSADSGVYAVYPHSRHLSLKARAFIDFLLECFRAIQNEALPDLADCKPGVEVELSAP